MNHLPLAPWGRVNQAEREKEAQIITIIINIWCCFSFVERIFWNHRHELNTDEVEQNQEQRGDNYEWLVKKGAPSVNLVIISRKGHIRTH